MTNEPETNRRTVLKTAAGGVVALGTAGVIGTASASQSVCLDAYIYLNETGTKEAMAREAKDSLEALFGHIGSSGHCEFDYTVHNRWNSQESTDAYPSVSAGEISEWKSWLTDHGHTEGADSGEAAVHHLVRHAAGVDGGGRGLGGRVCWPDDANLNPTMSTASGADDWHRLTVQHEVSHQMIDATIGGVDEKTHASAAACPHADDNETIHSAEHTLGTVVEGGKTVMAHRSPTAAECNGGGDGSGVGGDEAHGTGITPDRTSHAADKAFGITKREYS